MGSSNNILAVFAASPPPDSSPRAEVQSGRGDKFQNQLDLAMKSGSASQDTQKPPSGNSNQDSINNRDSKGVSGKQEPVYKETQTASSEESFDAHLEITETNPEPSSGQTAVSENQDRKTLEKLEALNLDQEKVNALLELLQGEDSYDAASLLQGLLEIAKANDLSATDSLENGLSQQEPIASANNRKNEIADLLVKAGISEQDANQFLEKLQLSKLLQNAAQKNLSQDNRNPAEAELTADDEIIVKLTNQESRQPGLNNNGESKSKTDFLSQFELKSNGQTDSPDIKASIQKVLDQESHQTQTIAPKEGQDKPQSLSSAQHERLTDSETQGPILHTQKITDGISTKAFENIKPGSDLQIQSVSGVGENAPKAVESGKLVLPETLASRAAPEAKVIQQIIDKFSVRSSGDQNNIKIRLDPPSLGTVRMNISTSGESVRTVIIADNHMVKQVIENNFAQLRDSLAGQGMKLDGFSVLVGGDSGTGGFNEPQGEGAGYGRTFAYDAPHPGEPQEVAGPSRSFANDDQSFSIFA